MTISVPVYPLQWPENVKRNPSPSGNRPFSATLNAAITNVRDSLRKFGKDTGMPIDEDDIVFSSNFGGVGLEVRQTQPKDAGVAVWFEWDKALRCIAVDRYDVIPQNVQAIHHLIEANRTKMRYGGLEIVRASFKGHIALPSPGKRGWRAVLGIADSTTVTKAVIESFYRDAARRSHPDAGGSNDQMAELNAARDAAMKEIGNG